MLRARFLSALNEKLRRALEALFELLSDSPRLEIYAVGGSVRDFLLGENPKDLDLELHGISLQEFENLMQKIGAFGVGKSFFVYKWRDIDISLPRRESKSGTGHRGFSVSLADTPREAALRRDFTVNALMINLNSGELIDFFGGVADLDSHILRVTCDEKFPEDSLRLLRAARFCAQLNFKIARENLELLRAISIDDLSDDRVFLEFQKILFSKNPMRGFFTLFLLGLDEKIFKKKISRIQFFALVRAYRRFSFVKNSHEFASLLPLFLLDFIGFLSIREAVDSLPKMPKTSARFLLSQMRVSFPLCERDLARIACRYPLRDWLAVGDFEIFQKANELGIYDKKFSPTCTPSALIAEGFSGAELGAELRKRCEAEICARFDT